MSYDFSVSFPGFSVHQLRSLLSTQPSQQTNYSKESVDSNILHITRLQHNNSINKIIMAINHRKKKSKSSSSSSKEQQHSSSDELFQYQVEKIIDDKLDKDGVTILYKTRWKGYSAGDDTWEPAENVASTGVSYYLYVYFSMHHV